MKLNFALIVTILAISAPALAEGPDIPKPTVALTAEQLSVLREAWTEEGRAKQLEEDATAKSMPIYKILNEAFIHTKATP